MLSVALVFALNRWVPVSMLCPYRLMCFFLLGADRQMPTLRQRWRTQTDDEEVCPQTVMQQGSMTFVSTS